MKRLCMLMMFLLAMAIGNHRVFAQSVTITLMPGWNWISVPMMDTLDFETALGSFTPAQGDIIKSQWSNVSYKNGHWKGQISQFYPGYGYKYYSNRVMPATVTFHAQQPTSQVVVTTLEPMLITAISAMGGGEVTTNDGNYVAIIVRGICWGVNPNPTLNDNYLEVEGEIGSFTASMTSLNIGTTYYVRAYAVTANETVYGNQKTFTTQDGIPTLTTADVTNITGESAISGGIITEDGGLSITVRGVCWSTSPNPTIADTYTTNDGGMGSFTSSIMGLNVNTTYYVRAYATTNVGTTYGNEVSFITRDGIPTLTTADISNINATSATSGGNIVDDGGLGVIARGVCWSTSPNPTISNSHTSDGIGMGSFTSSITDLDITTTYYVRSYVTTSAGTYYGEQKSFMTMENQWVDLGLPSGTLWATCNIGATTPDGYGIYVAWGEIESKITYDWTTYQYCMGNGQTLTKYCNNSSYGYNGFTDNLTTLESIDDAASANWGNGWRLPTKEEWQELYQNTTVTTIYGIRNSLLFTASNGNSLILPCAGYRWGGHIESAGYYPFYWSSSLYTDHPDYAWYFRSYSNCYVNNFYRDYGLSVRAVRSPSQN